MAKFQGKERILKAAKRNRKEVTYKGAPIRLAADFSTKTLQARREWQEIFQEMESKGLQPRLLYPGKLSVKWKSNKEFSRKNKPQRIHLHQTNSAGDDKRSILRKGKNKE